MSEYDNFMVALRRYGPAAWLNSYFDVLKKLLLQLSIKDDDPRLVMTVSKEHHLMINMGQRVISQPIFDELKHVGLIVPFETDESALDCYFEFPFSGTKDNEPKFVSYEFREGETLPSSVYDAWEQACIAELKRSKKSRFRRHHSSLFYETVMNDDKRKEIFQEAFAAQGN